MDICGIYKITSPSGKIYIGQSMNINKRWNIYKNLHCKNQRHVYHSIVKYGYESHKFEIIHQCLPGELNYFEKYYVDLHKTFNSCHGMNLKDGGGNKAFMSKETKEKMSKAKKGIPLSREHKENISKSNKGKKNTPEQIIELTKRSIGNKYFLGKTHSAEWRKMMSNVQSGRVMSKDARLKISIANIGNKKRLGKCHSQETKIKISNSHKGKKLSQEHKDNISRANKGNPKLKYWLGKHPSKETLKRMSLSMKGKNNWMKGRKFSEETKRRMSESRRNKPLLNKSK
jgi:group I intron endonuclease